MSLRYGFYNSVNGDRRYDANDMAAIFDGIIRDGVFASVGNAFLVQPGSGMMITVGVGHAWLNRTWTTNDSLLPLTVSPSPSGLARIDTVVLEINNEDEVRANRIYIIKGTSASAPVPQPLVKSRLVNQYALADIYVGSAVTTITQANITNKVGTGDLPFVTGILDVLNTDGIVAQWGGEFDEWMYNNNAEFKTWRDSQTKMDSDWRTTNQNEFKTWRDTQTNVDNTWRSVNRNEHITWYNSVKNEMNTWMSSSKSNYDIWFGAFITWRTQSESDFKKWFESVKNVLSGDVAGNLTNMINELSTNISDKASYVDLKTHRGTSFTTNTSGTELIHVTKIDGMSTQITGKQGKNIADPNVAINSKYQNFNAPSDNFKITDNDLYWISTFPVRKNVQYVSNYAFHGVVYYDILGNNLHEGAAPTGAKTFISKYDGLVWFSCSAGEISFANRHLLQIEVGSTSTSYEKFTPQTPSVRYPNNITSAEQVVIKNVGKNIHKQDFLDFRISQATNSSSVILNTTGLIPKNTVLSISYDYVIHALSPTNASLHHNSAMTVDMANGGVSESEVYKMSDLYISDQEKVELGVRKHFTVTKQVTRDVKSLHLRFIRANNLVNMSFSIYNLQVEISDNSTVFEGYSEDKVMIPHAVRAINNTAKDTIEYINGKTYHTQRVQYYNFTGAANENWLMVSYASTPERRFFRIEVERSKRQYDTDILCNRFVPAAWSSSSDWCFVDNYETIIISPVELLSSTLRTVSEFKTWLSKNNVQIQYELANPIVTEIPNIFLRTTPGVNHLYMDNSTPNIFDATLKSELYSKHHAQNVAIRNNATYESDAVENGDPVRYVSQHDGVVQITNITGKTDQGIIQNSKNLFDYRLIPTHKVGGVTFTNNNDGSFTLNGGSSYIAASTKAKFLLQSGVYTVSTVTGLRKYIIMRYKVGTSWIYGDLNQYQLTLTEPTEVEVYLQVPADEITRGLVITPQLEKGNSVTEYEPFIPATPSIDNPSKMESVIPCDIVVSGSNLFDHMNTNVLSAYLNESTKLLTTDTSGKSFIFKCTPNTSYRFTGLLTSRLVFSDYPTEPILDVTVLNNVKKYTGKQTCVYKTSSDAKYMVVYFYNSLYDSTPLNTITRNISIELGVSPTTYKPYFANSIIMPHTLRSVSDKICDTIEVIDNETYYVNRVGRILLSGAENYTVGNVSSPHIFRAALNMNTVATGITNVISDKFTNTPIHTGIFDFPNVTNECIVSHSSNHLLNIYVASYRLSEYTLDGFKTWIANNPITVQYELTTPIYTKMDNLYGYVYAGENIIMANSSIKPTITADFKSKLWSETYKINNRIATVEHVVSNGVVDFIDKGMISQNTAEGGVDKVSSAEAVKTLHDKVESMDSSKINKTDIVQNDTTNDTTKVASAAVVRALGIEIDTNKTDITALKGVKTATITTTWTGTAAPYTQVITVSGITAAHTPIIDIVPSTTMATAKTQLKEWAKVNRIVTGAGQITVTCYGSKPTVAIPIQIKGV